MCRCVLYDVETMFTTSDIAGDEENADDFADALFMKADSLVNVDFSVSDSGVAVVI